MTSGPNGALLRDVHRLFGAGTVAGLSEDQLLKRFVTVRDELAFEAIVARHGPMVIGVCRRVLRDEHDAEDAFQATFAILARKADSVRAGSPVGHWLHGVARRVALRLRAEGDRRRIRERVDLETVNGAPTSQRDRNDLRWVLDEEIGRLPEKYRAPILLCHLEGFSHDEAAERLAWPVGTVRGRLSRARELLRSRLIRRGIAPSAVVFTGVASAGAVPPALEELTIQFALRLGTSNMATAGVASARVAGLTQGVLKAMLLAKLKIAAVAVAGLVTTGVAVYAYQDARSVAAGAPGSRADAVKPAHAPGLTTRATESKPRPSGATAEPASAPRAESPRSETPSTLPPDPQIAPPPPPNASAGPIPATETPAVPAPGVPVAIPSGTPVITPGPSAVPTATLAETSSAPPEGQVPQPARPAPSARTENAALLQTPPDESASPFDVERPSTAPALAPPPRPSLPPGTTQPPVRTDARPPAPDAVLPTPAVVEQPVTLPPPRKPDPITRAPKRERDVKGLLERTRAEVEEAVNELADEEKSLAKRLGQLRSDLVRLRALQNSLMQPRGGQTQTTEYPVSDLEPNSPEVRAVDEHRLPNLDNSGVSQNEPSERVAGDEPGEPIVRTSRHTKAVLPPEPSNPTGDRLSTLEKKLDSLLQAMENMQGEIASVKRQPQPTPSLKPVEPR